MVSDIQLTQEQQSVVASPPGHYLITAVAGSGKTTTLAYRIRHLLEEGATPQRMLVLMFNRAAQQDFSARLEKVLPPGMPRPEVRTFHAMGYRLYQRFVREGYLPPFNTKILSEKEMQIQLWRLAREHIPGELQSDLKRNKKEHMELASSYIDAVKGQLQTPSIVFEALGLESKFRYFLELFDAFEHWRKQTRRISYADMLYDTVHAISANPALLNLVSNKMDMILVDEYQDTNDIQHALLKHIAGERANVTVVGDPDQTIYEFRGAKPEYMLSEFEQQFPGTRSLSLSHSFRYGHKVSLLANHLITRNRGRNDLLCISHKSTPQTRAQLERCAKETRYVVDLLQHAEDPSLAANTAILLRVWSQSISFELALLAAGIPYHMAEHKGVFASEELHALKALIELSTGAFALLPPAQRQSRLFMLMRFPHLGIPEPSMQQLAQAVSVADAHWGERLQQLVPNDIKKFQANKVLQLAQVLSVIEVQSMPVNRLLSYYVKENGLYEGIRSMSLNTDFAEEKIASIKSIIDYLRNCAPTTREVLEHVNLLDAQSKRMDKAGVLLTTIHRAKGLEWQQVLIPGFNDRHYPYCLRSKHLSLAELESERRLLYVAMTRAKEKLHLISPDADSETKTSRFEQEISWQVSSSLADRLYEQSKGEIELTQVTSVSKRYATKMGQTVTAKQQPISNSKSDDEPIWLAAALEHSILGRGRVINEGAQSFTVEFEDESQTREFSKAQAYRFFVALG